MKTYDLLNMEMDELICWLKNNSDLYIVDKDCINKACNALEFYADMDHEALFTNDCRAEDFISDNPTYNMYRRGNTEDGAICIENGSIAQEALYDPQEIIEEEQK